MRLSCPEGLSVPNAMSAYQLYDIFGVRSVAPQIAGMKDSSDPGLCTACGTCVEKCPQKLPIPERMERLAVIAESLRG